MNAHFRHLVVEKSRKTEIKKSTAYIALHQCIMHIGVE